MAKKNDDLGIVLLILFLPIVAIVYLFIGLGKLITWINDEMNEKPENPRKNHSGEKKIQTQYEKENQRLKKVKQLGKLGQSLDAINKKTLFLGVEHCENVECSTVSEYKNFNIELYLSTHFFKFVEVEQELQENIKKNEDLYFQYQREFYACKAFTTDEEIKKIRKRKMSIKKFKELEQRLHKEMIKCAPKDKISFIFDLRYENAQRIIKFAEKDIIDLLQKIREEREYRCVRKNSFAYKYLYQLNKKYSFYNIEISTLQFRCSSYRNYEKFNLKEEIDLIAEQQKLNILCENADENENLYREYCEEYGKLARYLRSDEDIRGIQNIDFSVERFKEVEIKLLQYSKLKEPIVDFSIPCTISYSSPAGRNYYSKTEYLNKATLKNIFQEREQKLLKLQEYERQKQWEKELKARERAEINDLRKIRSRLEKKEQELARREEEFKRATEGHIYSAESIFSVNKADIQEEREAGLSSLKKMELLKKSYENGEITYEEYSIKRENML